VSGDKNDISEVATRSASADADEKRYLRAWTRLRRCRVALALSLASWLPAIMVASLWDDYRYPAAYRWSDVVARVGLAVLVIEVFALSFTRCPRCRRHFTWTWYWKNPLTKECLNCGIRQYSLPVRE